jgi:hypothetical protein
MRGNGFYRRLHERTETSWNGLHMCAFVHFYDSKKKENKNSYLEMFVKKLMNPAISVRAQKIYPSHVDIFNWN